MSQAQISLQGCQSMQSHPVVGAALLRGPASCVSQLRHEVHNASKVDDGQNYSKFVISCCYNVTRREDGLGQHVATGNLV